MPHATHSAGDRIVVGAAQRIYGCDHTGRYLRNDEIGTIADHIDRAARGYWPITDAKRIEWIPGAAVRLRLARPGVGYAEALMILASAGVTFSDICAIHS